MLLRRWVPVAAWAAFIFLFSTSAFCADCTGSFLVPVLAWCFPGRSPEEIRLLHDAVRKLAHFTEYAILAILWFRALRRGGWRLAAAQWMTFGAVTVYACSDEFHQSFVPNRTAAGMDVLIDMVGGATALLVLRWWYRVKA